MLLCHNVCNGCHSPVVTLLIFVARHFQCGSAELRIRQCRSVQRLCSNIVTGLYQYLQNHVDSNHRLEFSNLVVFKRFFVSYGDLIMTNKIFYDCLVDRFVLVHSASSVVHLYYSTMNMNQIYTLEKKICDFNKSWKTKSLHNIP